MTPAIISAPEFAALMARFAPWPAGRPVAVAVSGGADSLCLAWLTAGWGMATGFIIDHGLRAESAAEAKLTQARLAAFGIESRIVSLDLAPGPGLAARARLARYAALAGLAAEAGLGDLLIGHHAGDQAETSLMRALGRSGPAGLAAMASLAEHTTVRIIRPLLGIQSDRLRATLEAAGLAWVEDPSNEDAAALRTRLRRQLKKDGRADRLVEDARRHGEARALDEDGIAGVLAQRVSIHPEGFALLSPGPIAPAAFARLLHVLTGAPYAPGLSSVAALADDPRPATCAGVQILPAGRLGPGLLLVREAAAMASSVTAYPGVVWDRRFRIGSGPIEAGTTVGALGLDAASLRGVTDLPAAVLRTMPALRRGGQRVGVPFIDQREPPPVVFCPATPLAGGPFFV